MDKKTLNLAMQLNEDISFIKDKILELEKNLEFLDSRKDEKINISMCIGQKMRVLKIDVCYLKQVITDQKQEFERDLASLVVEFEQL